MVDKKLSVAICGGGIGGLTLAFALSRHSDIDVVVYEAASEFAEIGAGIGFWPRSWKLLRALGLAEELSKVSAVSFSDDDDEVRAFGYRKGDCSVGFEIYQQKIKGGLIPFYRAHFQQVLLGRVRDACRIECSKRLRSYTQQASGPIELLFADGSVSTCDLLVGADGVKSTIRKIVLHEQARFAKSSGDIGKEAAILDCIDPVYSGILAFRTTIPAASLRQRAPNHRILSQPTQYVGKNGLFVAYPISKGDYVNVAAFRARFDTADSHFDGPWVKDATPEDYSEFYAHWEPEVQDILQCFHKPLQWAIHVVRPLQCFTHERVALLGDAAHAMTPFQGAGAGQAIEDAYVLATLLGDPRTTRDTIKETLTIYDKVRRPFANDIAHRSLETGKLIMLASDQHNGDPGIGASVEERDAKLWEVGEAATRASQWEWTTTADASITEALMLLGESLGYNKADGLVHL